MDVNRKIRIMREIKNWTQEEMAEKLGMSHNGYAKIERGETKLYLEKLNQIAQIFNIDLSDLISDQEHNVFFLLNETHDEAHREKSRHFLRKNFGSLLHYLQLPCTFIKATITVAFVLPVADNQFAAGFLRFVPTNGIGKLKAGSSEIFEQLSNIGMVVNRHHYFAFALSHRFCQ